MGFTGDTGTHAGTHPTQRHTPLLHAPTPHRDRTARVHVSVCRMCAHISSPHRCPCAHTLKRGRVRVHWHTCVHLCAGPSMLCAHACMWPWLYTALLPNGGEGGGAGDGWVPTLPLHTRVPHEHTGHTHVPAQQMPHWPTHFVCPVTHTCPRCTHIRVPSTCDAHTCACSSRDAPVPAQVCHTLTEPSRRGDTQRRWGHGGAGMPEGCKMRG